MDWRCVILKCLYALAAILLEIREIACGSEIGWNEPDTARVLPGEPAAWAFNECASANHKFASGAALRTSLRVAPHMPQQFTERENAFVRYTCV